MKVYDAAAIRNVALVGHGGSGKTQLASAMLFAAAAVNRLGKVDEGTTVTDFDEEEIARKHTLSSSLAFLEWQKTKINIIDTPGFANFFSDAKSALRVAEGALVCVDAVAGVEVQTEKLWAEAASLNLPRLVAVNGLERERASLERTLESLHRDCAREIIPIQLPIGEERGFMGVVDLVRMKALTFAADGSGKMTEGDVPAALVERATRAREELIEMVAEADERLMETFFSEGTLKQDSNVHNQTRDSAERFGHLLVLQGKTQTQVPELKAGDLGAVAKLKDTRTNDVLAEKSTKVKIPEIKFPEAVLAYAIEPKSRGDEDKISGSMQRLREEDPSINYTRDPQTHELLLAGQGQLHIEVTVAKLKRRFGVEVNLKPQRIAYRETITVATEAHGRHKKQTGGHGQFGDCKIRVEPLPRGSDFEFVDDIFGGAIPRQYVAPVAKGS